MPSAGCAARPQTDGPTGPPGGPCGPHRPTLRPSPLTTVQTTATPRPTAPLALPADVASLLARFGLSLPGLLTDSNPKLTKGSALARAVILHHLPHRALAAALTPGQQGATAPRSFLPALRALAEAEGVLPQGLAHNGCPWATAGCAAGCLAWAGHGGLSPAVAAARGRRTLAYLADPAAYGRAILWATARHWAQAQAQGLPLALRLRGTDDSPFHRLRFDLSPAEAQALRLRFGLQATPGQGLTLLQALALPVAEGSLRPYEYSKAPLTGPLGLQAQAAAGWDVTASLAADRATALQDAWAAASAGFRLAVPVALRKGEPLPVALTLAPKGCAPLTLRAIDGDGSDHRWADPQGVAVILRTKASRGAGAEAAAFSLRATPEPQALADGLATLAWA